MPFPPGAPLLARSLQESPSLNVCFVTAEYLGLSRCGGIGTAVTTWAELLAGAGWQVTVLLTGQDQHGPVPEQATGPMLRRLPPAAGNYLCSSLAATAHRVFAWLVSQDFDVVYFHDWLGLGYFSTLAKHQGLAFDKTLLCLVAHGPTAWVNAANQRFPGREEDIEAEFMERQSVSLADALLCPSRFMTAWMAGQGWQFPPRTYLLPYHTRLPLLPPRAATAGDCRTTELFFFGRLEERKGVVLFCDALDLLAQHLPAGMRVTFLGRKTPIDGEDARTYLERRARAWPCAMRLLPDLDRAEALACLVREGGLAVIASLSDNSPNTVHECLAAGIPLLAADVGGIGECIAPADRERVLFAPTPGALAARLAAALREGISPAEPLLTAQQTEAAWLGWNAFLGQSGFWRKVASSDRDADFSPLVSVCLIHHDRPEYLVQAVDSLKAQDYPRFEVVLVDDGSVLPQSGRLLDALETDFAARGWTILRQDNRYLGAARNAAAARARGEYLLFMDDDNLALPHELSTFIRAAGASGADILTCVASHFEGEQSPDAAASRHVGEYVPLGGALGPGFFHNTFGDANALIRKAVFDRLGGFSQDRDVGFEDWEFFARAVLAGFRLETVPVPLFQYRVSPTGMSKTTLSHENARRALRPFLESCPGGMEPALLLARGLPGRLRQADAAIETLQRERAQGRLREQSLGREVERLQHDARHQAPGRPAGVRAFLQTRLARSLPLRAIAWLRLRRDARLVRRSQLFDAAWYLAGNPDVARAKIDPAVHYLAHGADEGRDPGPCFNSRRYVEAHADVAAAGVNPLAHYLRHGRAEGRAVASAKPAPPTLPAGACPPRDPRPALNRFRILFVSHDADKAGAQTVLINLMRWLKVRAWVEPHLLLLGSGVLEAAYREVAGCVLFAELPEADWPAALTARIGPVDLVYANTVATAKVFPAIAELGVPIVTHVHELEQAMQRVAGTADLDHLLTLTDYFIAASPPVLENLVARHGVRPKQASVVFPFIEPLPLPPPPQADKAALRARLGLAQDGVLVVGCGLRSLGKGCDIFIAVAEALLRQDPTRYRFAWVGGQWDGCTPSMEDMVRDAGLSDRITLVPNQPDPREYFRAADMFLLPSREDAYPLACLEAAECGLPLLVFADAGGMPGFVGQEAGFVVPFGDVRAMAEKVRLLARDAGLRARLGAAARSRLLASHVTAVEAPRILALCREAAGTPPPVSVIVPNYNYARFLAERLDTILNQTMRDFELLILDDASTDDSLAVIADYRDRGGVRLFVNETNAGSPARQWQKGLALARGELVWIAEADDACPPTFLTRMLEFFADPEVAYAYCQSWAVDTAGACLEEYFGKPLAQDAARRANPWLAYTDHIDRHRWETAYCRTGEDEMVNALALQNVTPNVSAVLMRRVAALAAMREIEGFRHCHDWMLYVAMAGLGKVGYAPDCLNRFRRHAASLTTTDVSALVAESLAIKGRLAKAGRIGANRFLEALLRSIAQYTYQGAARNLPPFFENESITRELGRLAAVLEDVLGRDKQFPAMLIILPDAQTGGAETAAIRFANALATRHRVFLLNARPALNDGSLEGLVADGVFFLEGTLGQVPWYEAMSFGRPASSDWAVDDRDIRLRPLEILMRLLEVAVVVSHGWWGDKMAFALDLPQGTRWFSHLHGCRELLLEDAAADPDFPTLAPVMLRRVAGLIHPHEKNLAFLDALGIVDRPPALRLAYGLPRPDPVPWGATPPFVRQPGDCIFCLCARGILEKGWEEAILAVAQVNALPPSRRGGRRARLALIGDGPGLTSLLKRYPDRDTLIVLGLCPRPMDILPFCDVGLLPSRYVGESMPNAVIEYLARGLPAIVTDQAGLPGMVARGELRAGLVVAAGQGSRLAGGLAEAMARLMGDAALYAELKQAAFPLYAQLFDIQARTDELEAFVLRHTPRPAPRQRRPAGMSQRLRPLVICPAGDWAVSGVHTITEQLGKALRAQGIDFRILFTAPALDICRTANGRLPELPLEFLPVDGRDEAAFAQTLTEYFRRQAPCVLFCGCHFRANRIATHLPPDIGVIVCSQSDEPVYYDQALALGEACLANICPSRAIFDIVSALPGLPAKTWHIPNCGLGRDEVRLRAGMVRPALSCVYAGRLVQYQKRVLDCIALARALEQTGEPYRLSLIGEDLDGSEAVLRRELAHPIRQGFVRLPGRLTRAALLREFDEHNFFVLLSEFEGLSVALTEAMGRGLVPVAAAIKSGNGEVVGDGENGLLMTDRDYARWAQKMAATARDEAVWLGLSQAASRTVRENYTIERQARDVGDILRAWAHRTPA